MEKLKVFISSKMAELRDVREVVAKALDERGIEAWVYEAHAGARPEDVVETSLSEVEAADVYVGLFWQKYGEVTVQEYRHARALDKSCFIYIRDKDIQREKPLEEFLEAGVYDLQKGVTYDYFDSAVGLGQQVADDIMAWLVQRHREMTAEIQAARVSQDETARLQAEVDRLQAASRERLPQGTPSDYLAQQMKAWFETLGYRFESHAIRAEHYFEWIINIPTRRRYDRILVRGIEGEAEMSDISALRQAVDEQKTDEGWLVTARRKSQAACDAVEEDRRLFCYTFDELLDEHADFSGYLDWLEAEVKQRGIDRMYVPLACTKEESDPVTKQKIGASRYDERNGWIDGYIDRWLDDPSKEHISILGEFGTGKTWFALHYSWTTLQRYREAKERGVERPRLPLVIPLRDYAKAVSVESLFSEFFFRKHEIPLPGYSAFEQLNRMGKLLLIFDGFDEMAAKVDRQKMINNFWELGRVMVPGAKAILTCRTEHFPEAKEGRALLSAELKASTAKLTGEPPQFEVLELEKFDDDQIRQVLSFRADPATVEQVLGNPDLLDLARRPVMTEFILEALPDIEAGKPVDLSRVYLYAVRRKMERDIKAERTFTSLADKLYFLCELSWEMLSTDRMSLNYRLFPDRLRRLFGHAVQEQKDLDHWHYDMMGQTMLIRNADGDYTPAHRSLLEFFVAYKFAAELGALASDFTALAQAQSNLESAPPQVHRWSGYFRRERDADGEIVRIPPLARFAIEPVERLKQSIGRDRIDQTIVDLIVEMIDIESVLQAHEAWLVVSTPCLVKNILRILREILAVKKVDDEIQVALGQVLIKTLDLASEELNEVRDEELHLWQDIVILCIETLDKMPSMPSAHDFRALFFKNELHWWKLIWLRFLGKQGVDVLERDIADGMDEMDEILLGRAICYLGDIKSHLRYNEITDLITEDSNFLRTRALYYLWRVEPEEFYSRLHQLAQPIRGKILVSDDHALFRQGVKDVIEFRKDLQCDTEESPFMTLEILEREDDIALLITDINKPEMSGIEMINRFRRTSRAKYLPIIVLSVRSEHVYKVFEPVKVDLVMSKAIRAAHLLLAINLLMLYDCASLEQHLRTSEPNNSIFRHLY